ncbi:large ribosomal subunit protein mL66-like [Mytilus edulis]|uniref:large ribosomal subunit protein mL66-like n=1 Tax=Mytilus edulis TaxID=6550 RepID=UPI0039EEF2EE
MTMNVIQQIYSISRPVQQLLRYTCISSYRHFTTSTTKHRREIIEKTEGNTTVIEGNIIPVDHSKLLKPQTVEGNTVACPLCRLDLHPKLKYTDVLILRQFLTPEGEQLPKKISGLCYKQHREVKNLVRQAYRAGLLSEYQFPEGHPRRSQRSTWKWKKYNVYFEEEDKFRF